MALLHKEDDYNQEDKMSNKGVKGRHYTELFCLIYYIQQ